MAYVAAAAKDMSLHHPDEAVRKENKAVFEYFVPVVKGFSTEVSVEVASLGIQVHGGMGFIEETGVAQFYRDARILPIYEGTTAIQANDFVGRKVLRDGGAVASALAQEMRATLAEVEAVREGQDAEGFALIARNFERAIDAYEQATQFMLANAKHALSAVFLGSVPYLMLAGTVHAGWQMTRAALACARHTQEGRSTDFHTKKLATCVAYAAFVMPRAQAFGASILEGQVVASYAKNL